MSIISIIATFWLVYQMVMRVLCERMLDIFLVHVQFIIEAQFVHIIIAPMGAYVGNVYWIFDAGETVVVI